MIEVDYNEYKKTIEENMKLIVENHKLKDKLQKITECINYYAIENEDYSKIYNTEEKEILKIIGE